MKYIKLPAKHTRYKDVMDSRHGLLDVARYSAMRERKRAAWHAIMSVALGGISCHTK